MSSALDLDEQPEEVRDPQQIALRALALFAVARVGVGAPREEAVAWLKENSLWEALSPTEIEFLSTPMPTTQQIVNASWRTEALLVLVWALGLIETMPALNEQYDPNGFQALLPPYAPISVADFVAGAVRLPDAVLLGCADDLFNSHWEARDAAIHGRPIPPELHLGIIQERHHAINWATGYGHLTWDEVTTDT